MITNNTIFSNGLPVRPATGPDPVFSLDTAALRASLNELLTRHEVLRTTFASVDGVPVQVIGAPAPVPLPVIDLEGVTDPLAAARRAARADARQPTTCCC